MPWSKSRGQCGNQLVCLSLHGQARNRRIFQVWRHLRIVGDILVPGEEVGAVNTPPARAQDVANSKSKQRQRGREVSNGGRRLGYNASVGIEWQGQSPYETIGSDIERYRDVEGAGNVLLYACRKGPKEYDGGLRRVSYNTAQ